MIGLLFSFLLLLPTYRGDDGRFHLKLCYPGQAALDKCFEFKQTNNPFTADPRAGFELVDFPTGWESSILM